ncbi:MAG: ABC transporter permease [Candidatus Competibacterales bacterium]
MTRRHPGFYATMATAWLIGLFLLLPTFITVPVSLTPTRWLSMPEDELSLRHYQDLWGDSRWLASLLDSLMVGASATVLAVVIGTLCAIGLWRLTNPWARSLGTLVLLPLILPPVLSALALYQAWVALGLYDSFPGVILAHTILGTPFVLITVSTQLAGLDPRLERASRSLGAGIWTTTWAIVLPNIKAGVLSGAIFAFIISWDEVVVTLFISSRNVYTLPRKMWDGIRENVDPTVAAVASLLIAFTLVLLAAAAVWELLARRPTRRDLAP